VHDGDIILLTERIDLGYEYRVAMHELGHYVGMGHSEDPASVMYPSVTAQQAKPWFTDADWGSIQ
jgi:predicted Zn-dependent protease